MFLDDVNKGIHDPATGAANVRRLGADSSVMGMIGPLYDSVAQSELPVANQAGLAMISPSNTDVCLTQEPADGHCQGLAGGLRPHHTNNYFRVIPTELSQGAAAADLAYHALSKRHAYVVADSTWLGQVLANEFRAQFAHDGGSLVDQLTADVIYDPGDNVVPTAALRRQLTLTAPQLPLVGTNALATDEFAKAAGPAVRNSYYTMLGPYPPATASAAAFRRAYRQRYGAEPATSALAAFDATGVLLAAIGRAIDDAGGKLPNRQQVLQELTSTNGYAGAMGRFGFDGQGDTTLKWVSCFQWLAPTDRSGRFAAQFAVS